MEGRKHGLAAIEGWRRNALALGGGMAILALVVSSQASALGSIHAWQPAVVGIICAVFAGLAAYDAFIEERFSDDRKGIGFRLAFFALFAGCLMLVAACVENAMVAAANPPQAPDASRWVGNGSPYALPGPELGGRRMSGDVWLQGGYWYFELDSIE